jgi:transposase
VSETIQVATSGSTKRVRRTPAEKRRIVEATLVPGASIARVARENGVNANQVFQWRYEHKNGVGWAANQSRTKLLPVAVVPEPSCTVVPQAAPTTPSATLSASIHIELPGRALVSVEAGVDPELVRTVLGSLLR